jgi:2-C-methyl-D-erythritol 4-phosphate cytidylyltransferase
MYSSPDVGAILIAGGSSTRFGTRKHFELIGDLPIYQHVAKTFSKVDAVHTVVVVGPASDVHEMEAGLRSLDLRVRTKAVREGADRQESAKRGLREIEDVSEITIAIVHDLSRALVDQYLIETVIEEIREHGSASAGLEVVGTLKSVHRNKIVETVHRKNLWRTQTPQGARIELLNAAYEVARVTGFQGADVSQLLERIGEQPRMVKGNELNFKINAPRDLERAREAIS